jgi:replicative DNA helicase
MLGPRDSEPREQRPRPSTPEGYPGRVPPQDIEAERAVLGSVLLSNEAIFTAIEALVPEDFYRPQHQVIYQSMLDLATKSEPIDTITLQAALKAAGTAEQAGGLLTLVELAQAVPTAANIRHYAELVKNKAVLRRLIQAATEIAGSAFEGGQADEVLDRAERAVFEISMAKSRRGVSPLSEVVKDAFKRIEMLYEQKKEVTDLWPPALGPHHRRWPPLDG